MQWLNLSLATSTAQLESGTSGKTSFHIVPPLKLIALAELPTKQNHAAVSKVREVNESPIKVFQLNTETLKIPDFGSQRDDKVSVMLSGCNATAASFGGF
jgi:hypothetical protein